MNSVCLTGRTLQDPERRETSRGVVALFRLAVNGRSRVIVQIETWGHTAGVVVSHLKAGRHVEIHGRLAQRDWTDKTTGQKRTWNYVIADTVGFLDRKPVDDEHEPAPQHPVSFGVTAQHAVANDMATGA